jgi:hypothetical protein
MPGSVCLLFLALPPVFLGGGQDSPPASPGPDRAAIAKLVKQLGSSDFKERETASKGLEKVGFPALDALRNAAASTDAEVARRAAHLVEIIENGFDQLLADYRAYGLPLPPPGSQLIRFESGGRYILNDKLTPPTYFLGFLLQPGAKGKPPLLLVGTQEIRLDLQTSVEAIEPKPEIARDIDPQWWGRSTFELNAGLAIALQCKARGWNDLARELWTLSIKQISGHHFGAFYQPADLPPRTALACLAWAHYGNELVKPDTDRAKLARQIKLLFAAEKSLNTVVNESLLRSLEAALIPSKAKAGSVERLVDDISEMCNTGRRWDEADPRFARLAEKGFAAVPALIEHLDDDRLTRSIKQGMNNFPTWILRVKHVASDLLQELAGEEVGRDWLRRQQGWAVDKADALAWWEKARKEGEEGYFLAHVLPSGEKAQWPNSLMLRKIAEKYPQHLPKLYKTVLDERPQLQSWPVAEAAAKSSLPNEEKRTLFLHAAHHKNLAHRRVGLQHLQALDPPEFLKILLATLEGLPRTPKEPYWRCPEVGFAHLVLATDDPKAWEMLEKVAKRSDVGMRMQFMNPMNYAYLKNKNYPKRLAFLAAFLEDAEAPDVEANSQMFEGPHAGFTFRRLAVQDLAAMEIASLLGMPDQPDRDWTPQQWEQLRTKVKKALERKVKLPGNEP